MRDAFFAMAVFFPPEWYPQQRVLFSFPQRSGDWGSHLGTASRALTRAILAVDRVTPVTVLLPDEAHARRFLPPRFLPGPQGQGIGIPLNDNWIRDYGPITVRREGRPTLLDFTFDGWDGKFAADLDNTATVRLHEAGVLPWDSPPYDYLKVPLTLEGGSLETDGRGTLLTTTKCLLETDRNPGTTRSEMEAALHDHLGVEHFLWLEHGELLGDDTDAHIDTLARFLDPETIAYVSCETPSDPHYEPLARMREELTAFRTATGQPYRLLPLPLPAPAHADDGHRLPATYANFLLSNGHLFLPTYADALDATVADLLRRETDYTVVPLDCRPFIEQHGSLHCLTMQLPRFS